MPVPAPKRLNLVLPRARPPLATIKSFVDELNLKLLVVLLVKVTVFYLSFVQSPLGPHTACDVPKCAEP